MPTGRGRTLCTISCVRVRYAIVSDRKLISWGKIIHVHWHKRIIWMPTNTQRHLPDAAGIAARRRHTVAGLLRQWRQRWRRHCQQSSPTLFHWSHRRCNTQDECSRSQCTVRLHLQCTYNVHAQQNRLVTPKNIYQISLTLWPWWWRTAPVCR